MKGRHVLAWFDPESPRLPAEDPLPAPERAALHTFLTALRFGPNLDHRLDDERIAAILGGLGARIQLLQGPPGTGKTTTTSLAILTRILARRRPGDVILVAAHTHTAIDTLLARLLGQGADVMRQAAAHGLNMPRVGARKLISAAADERALWRSPHRLILAVHDEAASDHQNPVEAAILEAILAAAPPLPLRSVAVVTPHRAQRALLRERLAAHADAVDLIDTVERLQGGERPIILFSATESDPLAIAQRVEFILDLNRSNVAFSRTQQRLVVVCARTLLDYVPPEVDDYASALLWKHLRHLCDHELARTTTLGIPVTLRVPSDPTSAPKDLA